MNETTNGAASEVRTAVPEVHDDRERAAIGTDGPQPASDLAPPSAERPATDFPVPVALSRGGPEFIWDETACPADNFSGLGRALNLAGDLFRTSAYGGGLFLGSKVPNVPAGPVRDPRQLAALLADRVRLTVRKEGVSKGKQLSATLLGTMMASEGFLQKFRPIDRADRESRYLGDFTLTTPGFNDGGPGQRILHLGPAPEIAPDIEAIARFLEVMEFATNADRTNAVAAALTVLLRAAWPGAKPVLVASATKSHAGKDTVVQFAAGTASQVSVSYQTTDWALERSFVGAVKHCPHAGVIVVENARTDRANEFIRSGFLERFLTDREPLFFATGSGGPARRRNDLVVAVSTNAGRMSEDLLNRAPDPPGS